MISMDYCIMQIVCSGKYSGHLELAPITKLSIEIVFLQPQIHTVTRQLLPQITRRICNSTAKDLHFKV